MASSTRNGGVEPTSKCHGRFGFSTRLPIWLSGSFGQELFDRVVQALRYACGIWLIDATSSMFLILLLRAHLCPFGRYIKAMDLRKQSSGAGVPGKQPSAFNLLRSWTFPISWCGSEQAPGPEFNPAPGAGIPIHRSSRRAPLVPPGYRSSAVCTTHYRLHSNLVVPKRSLSSIRCSRKVSVQSHDSEHQRHFVRFVEPGSQSLASP